MEPVMSSDCLFYDDLFYRQTLFQNPFEFSEEASVQSCPLEATSTSHLWMPNEKLARTPQQSIYDGFYDPELYGFDECLETRGIGSCLLDASCGGYCFEAWPQNRGDFWQHEQLEVPFSTEAVDLSLFVCGSDEEVQNCDADWLPEGMCNVETQEDPLNALLSSSKKEPRHRCNGHPNRIQKKRSQKYEQPYKVPRSNIDRIDQWAVMQRTSRTVKGLTMCMRTLLRQLLAGTGWIVDASICRDRAICLIKKLIGPELEDQVKIDLPMGDTSRLPIGWKERHYTGILAKIMTYHLGTAVAISDLEQYITLRRGPYRLSSRFKEALGRKQWPPCMPLEHELRAFGCYRFGEAAIKRLESAEVIESRLPSY